MAEMCSCSTDEQLKIEKCENAVKENPYDWVAWQFLTEALCKPAEVVKAYERAVKSNPGQEWALMGLQNAKSKMDAGKTINSTYSPSLYEQVIVQDMKLHLWEFSDQDEQNNYENHQGSWFVVFNKLVPRRLSISLLYTLPYTDGILDLQFSHDANFLATLLYGSRASVFDVRTGAPMPFVCKCSNRCLIRSMVFSSDGRYLIGDLIGDSLADRAVMVWNIHTEETQKLGLAQHENYVAAAFSSDGKLMVTRSANAIIRLWELEIEDVSHATATATEISFQESPVPAIPGSTILAISPNKKLVAAGGYETLEIWDAKSGLLQFHWTSPVGRPGGTFSHLIFSSTSLQLLCSSSEWFGTTTLSKVNQDLEILFIPSRFGALSNTGSVAWGAEDNWILSGEFGGAINLWSSDGNPQFVLQGHESVGIYTTALILRIAITLG
jgi:WD40 repeat protein